MLGTLIRRTAQSSTLPPRLRNATKPPLTGVYNGRFKPKKVWPPDFSQLSAKEQFRFEKKYKRRVKLATARPRWDRFTRMAQLVSVTGVVIYSVLFMDWNTEHQPFQGLRDRFWGIMGAFTPAKRHERRNLE
ncbi:hypothetical protein BX600DRAFT_138788 [Xylariales sp. PMI_506]|nr:hypothetical protein BX600DRAFT_138788 [Xylariales sp. PMI_506]